ncbi:MAG: DUF5049 domain-containing protein [Halopenitus sp.]
MTNDKVLQQLASVRKTGKSNMLNQGRVQYIAKECGFHELVEFIEDASNSEYMEALNEMGEPDY